MCACSRINTRLLEPFEEISIVNVNVTSFAPKPENGCGPIFIAERPTFGMEHFWPQDNPSFINVSHADNHVISTLLSWGGTTASRASAAS